MKKLNKLIGLTAVMSIAMTAAAGNQPLPEVTAWSSVIRECPAYAKLFPLDYLASEYTICENLPGMLMLHTNSGADDRAELKGKPSRLKLEIPAFLRLAGICDYEVRSGKLHSYEVGEEEITRDGQPYRRYTVEFDKMFSSYLDHWFKQQLCLNADPDSRGKTGRIYWEVVIGGKLQPERVRDVRVVAPVQPPEIKTKNFKPFVWISTTTSTFIPEAYKMIDYWSGLSEKLTVYDRRPRNSIDPGVYAELEKRTDRTMFLMYKEAMIDLNLPDSPQPFYRDVVNGKYRGKLPMEVIRSGKERPALPVWYMVDDPDGLWDKYLTDGFSGIKKNYPEVRALIWDFEFNSSIGYDPGNLERFGKHLGLDHTPAVSEVTSKYSAQFRAYMIDLCCKLVEKNTAKMRSILPGVRWILCSDMPKLNRANNSIMAETQLLADSIVDGHMPMAYYSGRRFFDDIGACTSQLKKEFIALNNPAERYSEWFDMYSPQSLKQNILVSAALGGSDFGFWPNDMLTGSYFHAATEAFADVAQVEKFYADGKRNDRALRVTPADQEIFAAGELRLSQPYSAVDIKSLIHEKGDEKLLSIFNFSAFPAIVKVELPSPTGVSEARGKVFTRNGKKILEKEFLCEVPAGGYKLLFLSSQPADGTAAPQKELERLLVLRRKTFRDKDSFAMLRKNDKTISLIKNPLLGTSVVAMNNGTVSAMLDVGDGGSIRGLEFIGKKQLFTGGCYLGKLYFIGAAGLGRFEGFKFDGFEKNASDVTAKFSMTVPETGYGEIHSLSGLEVGKTITLKADNKLVFSWCFNNPTEREMNIEFRLHNIPCGGSADIKADGNLVTNTKAPLLTMFARPEANISFLLGQVKFKEWSGNAFTFEARREGVPYRWTFDCSRMAGVFFNNNRFFTVEPLSGIFTLKPGESKTFDFTAKPELR